MLLDRGLASVNLTSFKYYDRMYPSQDAASSLGNLIALPMQGRALKDGNSAFVDENWNAYPDQWDILLNHTKRLSVDDLQYYMTKWQSELNECHHAASPTAVSVLQKVNARYVYGVSATPKRTDELDRIIFMLLGPVRHSFTAKERAIEQGIGHFVYPRYTRLISIEDFRNNVNGAFDYISKSPVRNEQIIDDARDCVKNGRSPVILTRLKEQAKLLYDKLQNDADHIFLLYGDNTDKENMSNILFAGGLPIFPSFSW